MLRYMVEICGFPERPDTTNILHSLENQIRGINGLEETVVHFYHQPLHEGNYTKYRIVLKFYGFLHLEKRINMVQALVWEKFRSLPDLPSPLSISSMMMEGVFI